MVTYNQDGNGEYTVFHNGRMVARGLSLHQATDIMLTLTEFC